MSTLKKYSLQRKYKISKKRRTKKQKPYKMIGCAHCRSNLGFCKSCGKVHSKMSHDCKCGMKGKCMRGGDCNSCGSMPSPFSLFKGGSCGTCGVVPMMGGCGPTCGCQKGGDDAQLAYTGKPFSPTIPPPLAYTGRGGAMCASCRSNGCGSECNCDCHGKKGGAMCASCRSKGCRPNCKCKCHGKKGGAMASLPPQTNLFPNFSNQKGGYLVSQVGTPYPDGLVGNPWTPGIAGWPSVNGVGGDRNYLAHNDYNYDPQRQPMIEERSTIVLKGGKGRKGRKGGKARSSKRGGTGLIPDDLVNLGRSTVYNVGSAINTVRGYPASDIKNPLPFVQEIGKK